MIIQEADFFETIFDAYPHQKDYFRAFFSGEYQYFMEKLHRRAGKDAMAFHATWIYACIQPGNYVYTLPKIAQSRNVVWEGKDLEGTRWVNKIPRHLIKSVNSTQCKIYFYNGSILHITGADSLMNAHLGSNLKGIVISEFQKTHPAVWDYVRPIIKRSGGWAMFLFTAYGKGHAYRLYEKNKTEPNWHCRTLTVADTRDNNGNYIFSPEQIEEERRSGMEEDIIQQEYYCSDDATIKGTYFSDQLALTYKEGRIQKGVTVDGFHPIYTSWDLGVRDTNSIWFFQYRDKKFHYFYQHDCTYGSIDTYLTLLQAIKEKFNFKGYEGHFMPHDVSTTEWTSGKTRIQTLREKGLRVIQVPKLRVIERVQVARSMFHQCVFDEDNCKTGIDALSVYRSNYNADLKEPGSEVHDWASHPATAFQYGLVGWMNSHSKEQLHRVSGYGRMR